MIIMTPIDELAPDTPQWNTLRRDIALYKRIRQRAARGKVLHLLEPQPLARVGNGWEAIGSYDEVTDSAVVLVFRLVDATVAPTVPLHGLRARSRYRISFADRPDTFAASGAALMRDGLHLELPTQQIDGYAMARSSEIVFLEPEPVS